MSIFTDTDTARFYPDEWAALKRCIEFSTIPEEPPPDDGPGQDTDVDGIPQGWRCRACGGAHPGKHGCPEIMRILFAPALAYTPTHLCRAHTDGTLIALLCSLDRIELEAHAQALAAYLIDSGARARRVPASYAGLPHYTALLVRRWRAMLATRPIGVVYEVIAQ